MLVIIFFSIAFVFALIALHPYTTYPLSLWAMTKFYGKQYITVCPSLAPSSFSIVFCAYNEEKVLGDKIANLAKIKESFSGQVEVLAYNDCSSDLTPHILNQHQELIKAFHGEQRTGKSTGMNCLVHNSCNDIIVFTDANSLLSESVLDEFKYAFSDPTVGLACGHLQYVNSDTATANVGKSYWKLEELIKELEYQTGSVIGADGSLFAIRKSLYTTVPANIIDDFFTSMGILCSGHRLVRCEKASAYERSVNKSTEEYQRKVRISCRAFNCHRLLWPKIRQTSWLNRYKYISHRLLRWLTIIWLAISVFFFVLALLLAFGVTTFLLSVAGLFIALLALRTLGGEGCTVFGKGNEILMAVVATGHGVLCSLRGMYFQTWAPAQSTRMPGQQNL